MDPESLIRFLVGQVHESDGVADELLLEFESSDSNLFAFLGASGFGDREEILRDVANGQNREYLDLEKVELSSALLSSIDADIRRIFACLPIEVSESCARVCVVDPFDDHAVEELSSLLGKPVEVVIADPGKILAKLEHGLESGDDKCNDAPVAASLGYLAGNQVAAGSGKGRALSSVTLVALCVLAVTASATAAFYLRHNKRLEDYSALVAKNESIFRQSEAAHKVTEAALFKMNDDLEVLERLVGKKEADAIRVDVLQKEIVQLRGMVESLGRILAEADKTPVVDAGQPADPPESQP